MAKINTKLVAWEEVMRWCQELARKIKEAEYRPDIIIAIARGGYIPARLLCDLLDVNDLVSVQVLHWGKAAEVTTEAHVKYPVNVDMNGKKALIVDDIADTGESIIVAKKHITEKCKPDDVKVATMQWISPVCKIKPDFYVEDVREWVWYQYPWCRLEDTTQFIQKMLSEEGKNKKAWRISEIKAKFIEWYGIDVGDEYYLLALESLCSQGLLQKSGETYIVK